ncbi:MAG: glutamate racemase [Myxococcota bacterium]|nr:glutamate racemase [Myxococcota bacterium]
MQNALPIGVFDSGVGGLTVLKGIRRLLPAESLNYLGDTARVPYGTKSPEVVGQYAHNSASFLIGLGAKALVIACNTASAVAVRRVREAFQIPVVGVIEPGAAEAVAATTHGRIGVIGTEGTIGSGSYQSAIKTKLASADVFTRACPLLVPLAEEDMIDHPATTLLLEEYLAPFIKHQVDTLVLGCTHYPLFHTRISEIVGPSVTVIDSATAVAKALQQELSTGPWLNPSQKRGTVRFYTTDVGRRFRRVGERFLGEEIGEIEHVDLQPAPL